MRLLVVGSRGFMDYSKLKSVLDSAVSGVNEPVEIISGGANGADALAERYAKENGYLLTIFPAEWEKYGKSAGYRRNKQMHEYISKVSNRLCVAFWDGQSKGTAHSFSLAEKYGNPIRVVRF